MLPEDLEFGLGPDPRELQALLERAQRAFAWRASVDELTGHADLHGIELAVASNGRLTRLVVRDEACTGGGEHTARAILEALTAAQEDLAEKVRRSAMETFGDESHEVTRVEQSLAARVGRASLLPESTD